jgi:3',5'-cyclic AMP phosphodiesterase CpdA
MSKCRVKSILRFCLVIMPGDVTDMGAEPAWGMAAEAFRHKKPVLATPGNHDYHFRHVLTQEPFSNSSFTDYQVWSRLARTFDAHGGMKRLPLVKRLDPPGLLVVILDSNGRPTSTPITNALGFVGKGQLDEAAKSLSQARRPGDVIFLLLHHHIISPPIGPWDLSTAFLRCLDASAVLDFALENQVNAIIHGHEHMPYIYQVPRQPDPLLIISCGSIHHLACGPFAKTVSEPSAYKLSLVSGSIASVMLLKRGQYNNARQS